MFSKRFPLNMVAINFIEPAKVEEEVVVEEVKEESPVAEAVVITQAPEFVEVYEDVVSNLFPKIISTFYNINRNRFFVWKDREIMKVDNSKT